MININNSKLIIQKQGKTIFILKGKKPKKSQFGELDIMLDAGNGLCFHQVVAGEYFKHFRFPREKINAISWHGYYEMKSNNLLYTPIVHFKNNYQRVSEDWHLGTINQEEPFAFPVCSLYIPFNMDVSSVNKSEYKQDEKNNYIIRNVDSDIDKRIDLFVTPKGVSAHRIIDSSLGFVYTMADVDIFNTKLGLLTMLREINYPKESYIEIIEDFNGHDLILRSVGKQDQSHLFTKLEGSFNLLLHDPNDAYGRLINRPVLEIPKYSNVLSEQGLLNNTDLLKNKYEEELKSKK